jgi:type I restriction enzyme S subunit
MWSIATRKDRKGFPDAELLSVYREYGVVRKADRDDNHNVESDDLSNYKYVKKGDLVLNKMKTWQGSLGVSSFDGIVSPAYFTCELSREVHGPFIHYLLRSKPYIAMYGALSKGIRIGQWDLPYEEFRDIPVLLPPLEVQKQIARFLDVQVFRINEMIDEKKKQLKINSELVRTNLYQSFVNEIGKNGSYQLPYLDKKVHNHCYFGNLFDVSLGKMVQPEPKSELDIFLPYLNAASMSNLLDPPDQKMWVSPNDFKSAQVTEGDLLVVEGGDVGNSLFYQGEPVIIQNSLHRVRATSESSLSYAHAVLSLVGQSNYFSIIANGATIRHLTLDKLRKLRIPYFPTGVQ